MDVSKLLNVVTNWFLWQSGLLYLSRSNWIHVKTECQTAKIAVGTGGGKSGGKPVPVYPQHHYAPAGVETPSPLLTHCRWWVDVLIYTFACCLGMCHAAAQCIQHCSMASGWPQAVEHQKSFCAPMEKHFFVQGCCLPRRSKQRICRYVMQNLAVVWWAQPCQEEGDLRRKERGWGERRRRIKANA